MKVSLHQSGKWRVAFNKEFVEKNLPSESPLSTNRVISKWSPKELCPGVILAFRILVPECTVTIQKSVGRKPIYWIPAPSQDMAIEISIFLTYPEAQIASWPGALSMKTSLVGKFELQSMKKVWVAYRAIEMPQLSIINDGKPVFFRKVEREELETNEIRALLIADDIYGSKCFLERIIKPDILIRHLP